MTTFARPPGRYDDPRPLSRRTVVVLTTVLGAALLALTFAAWQRLAPSGTSQTLLGYRVLDDRTVELRFRVDKDPGATVTCTLGASNADHQPVGTAVVTVGPSRGRSVEVVRTLHTVQRAVAAFVTACSP